MLMEMIWTNTE